MYSKNGYKYAEAGKLLVAAGCGGYAMPQQTDCAEVEAPTDDLRVAGGVATWAGGCCALRVADDESYASIKARLVKLRYSNDDQIAVMLNGEAEELERMQQWRQWSTEVARGITGNK